MTSLVSLTYEGWPVGGWRSKSKEEQGWGRMRGGREVSGDWWKNDGIAHLLRG